jgi:hypothetical protein
MARARPVNLNSRRWNYYGDINLEYGGTFWREDGSDDYVRAVRVTPCSEAGGPSNLFHIEDGSIFLWNPGDKRRESALECCGYTLAKLAAMSPRDARRALVESVLGYAGLDGPENRAVQVGAKLDECGAGGWNPGADYILRANASLRRFVRSQFCN